MGKDHQGSNANYQLLKWRITSLLQPQKTEARLEQVFIHSHASDVHQQLNLC